MAGQPRGAVFAPSIKSILAVKCHEPEGRKKRVRALGATDGRGSDAVGPWTLGKTILEIASNYSLRCRLRPFKIGFTLGKARRS